LRQPSENKRASPVFFFALNGAGPALQLKVKTKSGSVARRIRLRTDHRLLINIRAGVATLQPRAPQC